MRGVIRTCALVAASLVIMGGAQSAAAQTSKATPPADKPTPRAERTARSKTRSAPSLVANGTIASFDPATNTLTLSTPKGQEQFMLDSSVRVQQESRHIGTADLEKLSGRRATVRYTESGGHRMVQSVRVGSAAKATKR